ncbi:hypothetical protein R3P38DRAFT_3534504, partial [Favolaschia claudopus]
LEHSITSSSTYLLQIPLPCTAFSTNPCGARAHGRSEDPHRLAPMDMPIGSDTFRSHLTKVAASRDLTRVAAGMGSTPDVQANVRANQAAIGKSSMPTEPKHGGQRMRTGVTAQMRQEWKGRNLDEEENGRRFFITQTVTVCDVKMLETSEASTGVNTYTHIRLHDIQLTLKDIASSTKTKTKPLRSSPDSPSTRPIRRRQAPPHTPRKQTRGKTRTLPHRGTQRADRRRRWFVPLKRCV